MSDIQSYASKSKERYSKNRQNSNIKQEKLISLNANFPRYDNKRMKNNQINLDNQSQIKSIENKSENLEGIKSVMYGKDNKRNETSKKPKCKTIANFSELKNLDTVHEIKKKNKGIGKDKLYIGRFYKFDCFTNVISESLSEEKKIKFFCFKEEVISGTEKISNKHKEILIKKDKKDAIGNLNYINILYILYLTSIWLFI